VAGTKDPKDRDATSQIVGVGAGITQLILLELDATNIVGDEGDYAVAGIAWRAARVIRMSRTSARRN
jgi:hypothetical protein